MIDIYALRVGARIVHRDGDHVRPWVVAHETDCEADGPLVIRRGDWFSHVTAADQAEWSVVR